MSDPAESVDAMLARIPYARFLGLRIELAGDVAKLGKRVLLLSGYAEAVRSEVAWPLLPKPYASLDLLIKVRETLDRESASRASWPKRAAPQPRRTAPPMPSSATRTRSKTRSAPRRRPS